MGEKIGLVTIQRANPGFIVEIDDKDFYYPRLADNLDSALTIIREYYLGILASDRPPPYIGVSIIKG